MVVKLEIEPFMRKRAAGVPVLDVRSPGEFARGRIPGAANIALFDNSERAVVGTLYKQRGREAAIEQGLRIVGPKLVDFVRQARENSPDGEALVHCWRGGMRSQSMANLFHTAGISVSSLIGGYKFYRRHVLASLERPYSLLVVGGKTGSGKTEILHALAALGEQVVDLEGLANHKGSAFGGLGAPPQPSVEMFENLLSDSLASVVPSRRLWVEDESASIGRVYLPRKFFEQMRLAPVMIVDAPASLRITRLVRDYGDQNRSALAESMMRIKRRLGDKNAREAAKAVEDGELARAAELALAYYDKAYERGLARRSPASVHPLQSADNSPQNTAKALIEYANQRL